MALTQKFVDSVDHSGSKSWDWQADGGTRGLGRGFGLRVFPSGRKSYALRYRTEGRQSYFTIGDAEIISLRDARERAHLELGRIAAGGDPQSNRRRVTSAPVRTLAQLCDHYMERHARAHKKTWPEDQRRIDSHIKPGLGTLPIGRVTRTEVEALHRRIGTDNGRYEANRTLALIKRIWNLGAAWDLVPASSNPASGVQTFRERKRDRYILEEEAKKFLETVDEEDDWQVRAAVWLALLTGARRSEVLSRRWSDVDAVRGTLRVEFGKGASLAREPSPPHYYELSQLAVEILMDLPSASLDEAGHLQATNEWVFPSPRDSTSGHRESIKSAWTRIRKKSGLDGPGGIVFHDLRRTLGSDMANQGEDLHLIGSVMGHRDPRTTQIYARLSDSVRHRAVEEFSQRILDRTGIDPVRNRDDAQSAQVLAVV